MGWRGGARGCFGLWTGVGGVEDGGFSEVATLEDELVVLGRVVDGGGLLEEVIVEGVLFSL